ncbi:G/U mismatch-specific DNA glycosylase [Rhizobium leucaenae]|uniref:G/U mismatch-specific DNA glycosylase n=1 Tax=Rhizobium leucaenae TaxID=29450 RepID=UPI001615A121|nr:G/U mismatch-specific DNA glycosylase [Rhizobium leucaenae]MBB6305485.1 TDG/mug DNA glycosylase family protein [Rhizobium leucaenae]
MSVAIDATAGVNGFSDILAPGLSVIFCGLNPALSAVRDGHNFSNRSNRFWRVLHLAGFTPGLLQPEQEREILSYGFGLTTAVPRATKSAGELTSQDYLSAAPALERKISELAPGNLAFLGKAAYAAIAVGTTVQWGRQPDRFAGASVWVLPNTSGLNRAFTLDRLVEHFRELRSTI